MNIPFSVPTIPQPPINLSNRQFQEQEEKEEVEEKAKEQTQPSENEEQEEIEEEEEAIENIVQENKEYEELAKELTSAEFTSELAKEAQQAAQQIQDPSQAQELAQEMAKFAKQLQQQVQHLQYVAFDDIEGGAEEMVDQQLGKLKQDLKNTEASLAELCKEYNLPVPDTKPEPPINKEMLKGAFNQALDMLLPASDLIKIALGTKGMPTNSDEWMSLAVSTVLDFLPGGKMLRLLKSSAVKRIEGHILKLAAKKAKKAKKATG